MFNFFGIQDHFDQIQDNGQVSKIQDCPVQIHSDGHPSHKSMTPNQTSPSLKKDSI
jgi:hypothetical protein